MKRLGHDYRGLVARADEVAVHVQARFVNLVFDVHTIVAERIAITHLEESAGNAMVSSIVTDAIQREINRQRNVRLGRRLLVDDHILHALLPITMPPSIITL